MRNRYRIIYYVPNTKHGNRFALGALVERGEKELEIIRAERAPCPCCFDFGINRMPHAERLLTDLADRHMPSGIELGKIMFTQHLRFGVIRRYPSKLDDPAPWLRLKILPR